MQKAHVETRPVAKDKSAYILQMGSFRKFADADRMKARLALIGIEAEIQRVSINKTIRPTTGCVVAPTRTVRRSITTWRWRDRIRSRP